MLTDWNRERYVRQIVLPEIGEEGQQRLRNARVLIVGAGGLGSAVAPYLAAAGVGTLVITDPDKVSVSNLQRQILYTEADTGLLKADRALGRLRALNSSVIVETCTEGLTRDNAAMLVSACDVVVDCCDNYATRILIDDTCSAYSRPWIYGSAEGFSGQVSVFGHRTGRRYRELFPDIDGLSSVRPGGFGVIGPAPGAVGAVQASECIKLLTGAGEPAEGRLWILDLLTLNSELIQF